MESIIKSYHATEMKIVKRHERGIAPAPVILDYAEKNEIDLIVMGTHGRRGLKHLLLGSVAEEVVRLSASPVLTIHEQKEPIPFTSTMERILVPVDFSVPRVLNQAAPLSIISGTQASVSTLLRTVGLSQSPL